MKNGIHKGKGKGNNIAVYLEILRKVLTLRSFS